MIRTRLSFILTGLIMIVSLSMILSGCKGSSTKATGAEKKSTAEKLDEFMTAYNENCSYKYSGAILVAKGDQILLDKGYGMADYEKNIPNTSDSVFAIGSITKAFTAIGVMQLQEKGLLNVNDPISKYIEGNKRGDNITIHQLLTHTSGLVRDGKLAGPLPVTLEENVEYINNQSMSLEPREDFSYSNAGYNLLAAIIEKVSGQSYNDYISEHILVPLNMDQSRGGIDNIYAEDQSIGYEILTNDPRRLKIYNLSCVTGSGNIYSTVRDLYKFDRGIHDQRLLTKESLDKVFSPQWGDWKNGYGYGWEITEKSGHKKISHGGNIGGGGYVSSIIRYPEDDYVIILLTNNSNTTALNAVSQSLEAILFDKDYVTPEKLKPVKVDPEILQQYAGDYEFGPGFIITITYRNGKLYSLADDGNTYELIPVSDTTFIYEDHEFAKGEFIKDKEGNGITYKIQGASNLVEGKKVQ